MTLSFGKLSSLQQIKEKNPLLTLVILKLLSVELILVMLIKDGRTQGSTDPVPVGHPSLTEADGGRTFFFESNSFERRRRLPVHESLN